MKKFMFLSIATLFFGVALGEAGDRKIGAPRNQDGNVVQNSDYAGVSRSTISLSTANVLCFSGEGVVVGFVASTNTSSTDYLIFRDTGNLIAGAVSGGAAAADDYTTTGEFMRVNLGTMTNTNLSAFGTIREFPAPILVKKGLAVKPSVGTINMITILFHKFGKDNPAPLNP